MVSRKQWVYLMEKCYPFSIDVIFFIILHIHASYIQAGWKHIQVITSTNQEKYLWCNMAPLGLNELILFCLVLEDDGIIDNHHQDVVVLKPRL